MPNSLTVNRLFWLVAALSLYLCLLVPVFSQEAYYWTYSQHLDLSYYDHPPMVAWLMWLGTALFGDGALGIRAGTWLCGLGTTWLGLKFLRDYGVGSVGQRLWVLMGIGVPALAVARVLANPDAPLVFFVTAATYAIHRARHGSGRWWLLAGAAAGAGLLSKYTASFLMVSGVLLLLFDRDYRAQLRAPWIYLGVLVAALVFLPVVIWNFGNDFESFRFQTEGRWKDAALQFRWIGQLTLGQLGLLNPLLALVIPAAVLWLFRRRRVDSAAGFLLAFALPLPLYMFAQSLWIQVKINWMTPAYVPLLLGVTLWWARSHFSIRRPKLAPVVAAALIWVQLLALAAPLVRLVPAGRGSSWAGWSEVAECAERWEDKIDAEDGREGNVFFFAADYRDASQLGRSLLLLWREQGVHQVPEGHPDCGEPVMAQNVFSRPALQFDHWVRPESRIGQDAIFVLPRPQRRTEIVTEIGRHFQAMEKVEHIPVSQFGINLMDVDIYVCRHYRGPLRPC